MDFLFVCYYTALYVFPFRVAFYMRFFGRSLLHGYLCFPFQGGLGTVHHCAHHHGDSLLQTQMVQKEDARAQNCRLVTRERTTIVVLEHTRSTHYKL